MTALPSLLEPETLHGAVDAARDGLLLIHVSDAAAYHRAHLPGAQLVEPRELVSGIAPAVGELPSPERLQALFRRLGYQPAQHVVAYDDEGGGWAGRFIWTLDVIGHHGWSYLNGGIHAWHAAGLPLEAGPPPATAASDVHLTFDHAPVADAGDILTALGDPDLQIWDARSAEEFRGEKSGARRAGHIPGAVNLDWLALMDPARQLRLAEDLPERLARAGIDPRKRIITHCQSHHRSGLSYLVGRLLEFPRLRAYHGSWSDWGNRDDTPIERGA